MSKEKRGKPTREQIYGVYITLMEDIKHYDLIQTKYRLMASTFLLAEFVAIGFIFESNVSVAPLNHLTLISLIASISLILCTILCLLDLVFQERMSIANFIEAYRMEKSHTWLPQIHCRMIQEGKYDSGTSKKAIYYIGCGSCSVILVGLFFLFSRVQFNFFSFVLTLFVVSLLIFIYSIFILRFTRSFRSLFDEFYPEKGRKNG